MSMIHVKDTGDGLQVSFFPEKDCSISGKLSRLKDKETGKEEPYVVIDIDQLTIFTATGIDAVLEFLLKLRNMTYQLEKAIQEEETR